MDMLEITRHKLNWIRDAKSGLSEYPGDLKADEVIWQRAYFEETGTYWDPINGMPTRTIPSCLIVNFQHEVETDTKLAKLVAEVTSCCEQGGSFLTVFDEWKLTWTGKNVDDYCDQRIADIAELCRIVLMQSKPTVEAVASEFARLMREELTGRQMQAVLGEPKSVRCCRTHEFTDSNQIMLDALTNLNDGVEIDVTDEWLDENTDLIVAAWDRARENSWWVPHSVSETGHCEDCGGVCVLVVRAYAAYEKNGMVAETAQATLIMLESTDSEIATAARLGDTAYLDQLHT